MYRTSVARLLLWLDVQFALTTGLAGFALFVFDDKNPVWLLTNWRNWPSLNLGFDMDSTNMSASGALQYFWKCNIIDVCDYAHGCNRDANGIVEAMGLKDMWLCMVICWNVPHDRLMTRAASCNYNQQ